MTFRLPKQQQKAQNIGDSHINNLMPQQEQLRFMVSLRMLSKEKVTQMHNVAEASKRHNTKVVP